MKYFHFVKKTISEKQGEILIILNQGVILRETPYNAVVQFFSWLDGKPTEIELVSRDYLEGCIFYKNDTHMRLVSMLYDDVSNDSGKYFAKNMNGFWDAVKIVESGSEVVKIILMNYGYANSVIDGFLSGSRKNLLEKSREYVDTNKL